MWLMEYQIVGIVCIGFQIEQKKTQTKKTVCLYCGEGDGAFGAYAMMVMVQCWSINPDYGMGRCET